MKMKQIKTVLAAFVLAMAVASAYAVTITNRDEVITIKTYEELAALGTSTTLTVAPAPVLLSTDTDLTAADAQAYEGVPGQLLVSVAATGSTKIVYLNTIGTNWVLIK